MRNDIPSDKSRTIHKLAVNLPGVTFAAAVTYRLIKVLMTCTFDTAHIPRQTHRIIAQRTWQKLEPFLEKQGLKRQAACRIPVTGELR